jgi:hypothetical protein
MYTQGFDTNARAPVLAEDGNEYFVHNGLVSLQGPNYALAKTMQNWRVTSNIYFFHRLTSNPLQNPALRRISTLPRDRMLARFPGKHNAKSTAEVIDP